MVFAATYGDELKPARVRGNIHMTSALPISVDLTYHKVLDPVKEFRGTLPGRGHSRNYEPTEEKGRGVTFVIPRCALARGLRLRVESQARQASRGRPLIAAPNAIFFTGT